MDPRPAHDVDVQPPLAAASTRELVEKLAADTTELVKKELELAKTEMRADLKREIKVASGFAVAAVCTLTTLNLLLVALVLALAETISGWGAALIVAAAVLAVGAIAAAIGWGQRVKRPLDRTQRTLKEDAQWAKERMT